jgi:hypothetical protein
MKIRTNSQHIARPGGLIPPNNMLMSILGALTGPPYPAMKVF